MVSKEFELDSSGSNTSSTRRATVPSMERLLLQSFPVLDHGFVRVVDYMGDDNAIVQAARVSYGKGTKRPSEDRALIRYLMKHEHTSPFEMCEVKLHIKLPIFVARQWIRHRTASVNEYSGRYSVVLDEYHVPDKLNLKKQSKINKQGRSVEIIDAADEATKKINEMSKSAFELYYWLLGDSEDGVEREDGTGLSRELARIALPLSTYTQWYWKTDLHNLFRFLRLRLSEHAQFEIRTYAEQIDRIVKEWVPLAHGAFHEYEIGAKRLSATQLAVLSRLLKGEVVGQSESGLSPREWAEIAVLSS